MGKYMTLNNKLAFEIWVGIVVLVIVVGGIAGVTLLVNNGGADSVKTQAAVPVESPAPTSEAVSPTAPPQSAIPKAAIEGAAGTVADVIGGGTQ